MSANGSGDGVRADSEAFVVGGLPVPPELAGLIRAGKWVPPAAEVLRRIFDDEPVQPCFYSEAVLVRENNDWHTETDPVWLGDPADERNEGIAPERSLSIADLGPDMPVMLDYRQSLTSPRVLYMNDTIWVEVAANIEEFLVLLYGDEGN
uniref:Knr4/Smi1-like domain-containing protein n=1 Tax=Streptomyces sp. NBC_00008 TaxID=2903610 RepID=A0AAU2VPA0_9ACTN